MRKAVFGFVFGISLVLLFSVISSIAESFADETDYQRRLSRLKQAQTQTNVLLNRLGGFSSVPNAEHSDEQDKKERSLFRLHGELHPNRIATGSVYKAFNQNLLIVGGEPATGILELFDDQGSLSGLRVLANATPSGIEGRIKLEINRLLLHSGKVVAINAVGLDPAGAAGLQAQVFSGKALAVLGSIASSFVAGVAAAKQTQTTNVFGFSQNQATGRNAILGGVAQTAADQSKRLIDEATSEKPVLVLEEKTPIAVFFQEEVRF